MLWEGSSVSNMTAAPSRARAEARSTRPAASAALPLGSLLAVLLQLLASAQACTVFELMSSGFAANAVHLMHAEAIFGGGACMLLSYMQGNSADLPCITTPQICQT